MKRKILAIALTLFVLVVPTTYAQDTLYSVSKSEVVNDDYFAFGDRVEITGTVNGDVYAFAKSIVVDGTINGDLIAAAETIIITGKVRDDVRAASQNMTVGGIIGKDLTIAGEHITLMSDLTVGDGILAAGSDVTYNGKSARYLKLAGQDLHVNGGVTKDVDLAGAAVGLGASARIAGDITYWSDATLSQAPGATISGTTTKREIPVEMKKWDSSEFNKVASAFHTFWNLAGIVSSLIIGLMLLYFFGSFMERVAKGIKENTRYNALVGVLTLIITPLVILFTFLTLIGIPAALTLGVVFVLFIYLAKIPAALFIGTFIADKAKLKQSIYLRYALGLCIYVVTGMIPVLGGIAKAVLVVIAIGSLLSALRQKKSK